MATSKTIGSDFDVYVDPVLSEIYKSYNPDSGKYIFDELYKPVKVDTVTAKFGVHGHEHLRILEDKVSGMTPAPLVDYSLSLTDGYHLVSHEKKFLVTKQHGENLNPGNWEAGVEKAKRKAAIALKISDNTNAEYLVHSTLTNVSVLTQNVVLSGSEQLNNKANSRPSFYARIAKKTIRDSIGIEPNVVAMHEDTADILRAHSDLKAQVFATSAMPITDLSLEQLAQALGVKKVLVSNARYNTTNKGQTDSLSRIWGNDILFAYVNPNSELQEFEQSLAYKFWREENVLDVFTPLEPLYAWYVRRHDEYDRFLWNANAAYLIKNAVNPSV